MRHKSVIWVGEEAAAPSALSGCHELPERREDSMKLRMFPWAVVPASGSIEQRRVARASVDLVGIHSLDLSRGATTSESCKS